MVLADVGSILGSEIVDSVRWLVTAFKIFLGIVGISFIFWIITFIINRKRDNKINEILQNVKEINANLNKRKK
jgi:hypothetical protein